MTDIAARADTRADYERRVRRALAHLDAHPTRRVPLDELARVAGFAPFHFHRVFKAMTGRTARDYALRLRLERAALRLRHGDRRRDLTEVALEHGFPDMSSFSRAFKAAFGVSPSAWRRLPIEQRVLPGTDHERPWALPDAELAANPDGFAVTVAREDALELVTFRVRGAYEPERLIDGVNRMTAFAAAHGVTEPLIGMSEDDPDVTPPAECRYDWAVPRPRGVTPEPPFVARRLRGGAIATMRVRGDFAVTARAWDWLFRVWLPASGYEPRDQPAREHWLCGGRDAPASFDLRYVLPIVRLRSA